MTKKLEFYKCKICGNLIEVVLEGEGELVCCGEIMELQEANTVDGMGEKHVPVFDKKDNNLEIKIGAEPHPMINEHYIQFIECVSNDEIYIKRKYLKPGEAAILKLTCSDIGSMTAREFCNVHGLWESKYD